VRENKDIKFRAWNNVDKTFEKWDDIWKETNGSFLAGMDVVIEQFTGLHDKNGKEIYEGDILDRNGFIEFAEGAFVVYGWEPIGEMAVEKQIVIGNIHENPDLIKN